MGAQSSREKMVLKEPAHGDAPRTNAAAAAATAAAGAASAAGDGGRAPWLRKKREKFDELRRQRQEQVAAGRARAPPQADATVPMGGHVGPKAATAAGSVPTRGAEARERSPARARALPAATAESTQANDERSRRNAPPNGAAVDGKSVAKHADSHPTGQPKAAPRPEKTQYGGASSGAAVAAGEGNNCAGKGGSGVGATCCNGPQCKFLRQGKCSFYHPCNKPKCSRPLCSGAPDSPKKARLTAEYRARVVDDAGASSGGAPPSPSTRGTRSPAAAKPGPKDVNAPPPAGRGSRPAAAQQIGSVVHVDAGKNFVFIRPSTTAASVGRAQSRDRRGDAQFRDVHCVASRIATGGLELQLGDEVQFRLRCASGREDGKRDSTARATLIKLAKRPGGVLLDFLKRYVANVKADKPGVLQRGIECPAVWGAFAPPTRIKDCEPAEVAGLLVELVEILVRRAGAGSKAAVAVLRMVADAGVFNSGGLICSHEHALDAATCLSVFRCAPASRCRLLSYTRKVAAKLDIDKRDRFTFDLLKAATANGGTDAACVDWHDLPLVISRQEFEARDDRLSAVRKKNGYDSAEKYFETYFRLLREDCFATLRDCVVQWRAGKLDPRDMQVYTKVRVVGLASPGDRSEGGTILAFNVGVKVEPGNKQLMFGNLVAISPDSGDIRRPLWATVCPRDDGAADRMLIVELCTALNGEDDAVAVKPLLEETCVVAISPTFYRAYQPVLAALQDMAHADVPFADELVCVRQGPANELLASTATLDGRCIFSDCSASTSVDGLLSRLRSKDRQETTFDDSQLAAVDHVLTNRVALIQGPPGTGKTFIGTRLVSLLLSMRDGDGFAVVNTPIVVLTYKNHALDDFLSSCLDPEVVGEDHVGRVGGTNHEGSKLHACNVRTLVRAPAVKGQKRRDEVKDVVRQAMEAVAVAREAVEGALEQLARSHLFDLASLRPDEYTRQLGSLVLHCKAATFKGIAKLEYKKHGVDAAVSPKDVLGALLGDAEAALPQKIAEAIAEQLCKAWLDGVPRASPAAASVESHNANLRPSSQLDTREDVARDEAERLRHFEDDPSRKVVTGKRQHGSAKLSAARRAPRYDMIDVKHVALARGLPSSENERAMLLNCTNVWKLEGVDRAAFVAIVVAQQHEEAAAAHTEALAQFNTARARLSLARVQEQVSVLCEKKVVGMTITGASINRELLLQLKPSVVIVEEAAEVLEPQLLAALGPHVKQLIMIGDHKQLPPSVESYALVKDYHFDVSMMERLIESGLPYVSLERQGRMRPELALMLTDIYPNLKTNNEVVSDTTRPAPRCVNKSLFFWDHGDPEEGDRGYCNPGEADRVVKLAQFFVSEGYRPSQITVLAAYAQQVTLLRDKLGNQLKQVWRGAVTNPDRDARIKEIGVLESKGKSADKLRLDLGLLLLSRSKPGDLDYVVKLCRASSRGDGSESKRAASRVAKLADRAREIKRVGQDLEDFADKRDHMASKIAQEMFLLGRRHQIAGRMELAQATFVALVKALDSADARAALDVKASAERALSELRRELNSIEVHTIDRFQGAENDIVIVSLVRTEELGFLRKLNRRCVAQSRARCGLYFVGSAQALAKHKTWSTFIEALAGQGCIGPQITLQCSVHPTVSIVHVRTADDIDLKRGICQQKCLQPMAFCDHLCQERCHPDNGHLYCTRQVHRELCDKGHLVAQDCSASPDPKPCVSCQKDLESEQAHQRRLEVMRAKHEQEIADVRRKENVKKQEEEAVRAKHELEVKKVEEERAAAVRRAQEKARTAAHKIAAKKKMNALRKQAELTIRKIRTSPHVNERRPLSMTGVTDQLDRTTVIDRVEKFVQQSHGIDMRVSRIEKVTDTALEEAWIKSQFDLVGDEGGTKWLFHGTSKEGVKGITDNGFRLPERSPNNMFGAGVYFATDSSKSAQQLYTKGSSMLLLCEVRLGKSCTVSGLNKGVHHPLDKHVRSAGSSRRYLDVDLAAVNKAGFDTVFAPRDSRDKGGVQFDEFVVYNPRCAIPRFVVHFGGGSDPRLVSQPQPPPVAGKKLVIVDPKEKAINEPKYTLFNEACAQFLKLCPSMAGKIAAVEYWGAEASAMKRDFDKCKKHFRANSVDDSEIWVFHGTGNESNIESIMQTGFRVGGQDGHPITNGAALGQGVYSAIGPGTPKDYGRGSNAVIMCKALPGVFKPSYNPAVATIADSWSNGATSDWRILKTRQQVLPYYVLRFA